MTKKFTTDTPTLDEILALRKPPTEAFLMPLDGDVLDELEALESDLRAAERRAGRFGSLDGDTTSPEVKELTRQLEEMREAAEQASAEFRFEGIGRRHYRKLVDLCTGDDGKIDPDEFHPALLAVTCVQPTMATVDRDELLRQVEQAKRPADMADLIAPARKVWDEFTPGQTDLLSAAAMKVCQGVTRVPTGARSSTATRSSERNSTTASR